MPGLVRKLLIYAAVDGLVLQPVAQRGQRQPTTTTIDYKTHSIKPLLHSLEEHDNDKQLECYGIVGTYMGCLLYTSPSPRDGLLSRMPSSA